MAYTLTNLQDDIRNYTEVDSSVLSTGVLNTIIKNAENRIIKHASKKVSVRIFNIEDPQFIYLHIETVMQAMTLKEIL